MAARGRRAEPPARETPGPAGGGGGGSRWAESGPGTSPESGDDEVSGAGSSPVSGGVNLFANDGSFLELFKRKMEEEQRQRQEEPPPGPPRPDQPAAAAGPGDPKRKGGPGPTLSFVGKRRGGNKLALKTGIVAKKQKTEDEVSRLGVGAARIVFPIQAQLLAVEPSPCLSNVRALDGCTGWGRRTLNKVPSYLDPAYLDLKPGSSG
ncbi:telomerase RNA component interacting RNase isoform X1 [Loxodonta africana]|uniref:telomerase RNA component interacting RNase isoform X1 n=1 Tax=Loxodonta africana TaxID=9785 RepID=UPI000C812774|nr:telomerase RNA component interacting RNase isoform X1 [Loxodonta africana]